jgi:hypothetical protein
MKVGTQKLIYEVEDVLYRNHVTSGKRRIAKEIVERVMELIGDDMSKKDWNQYHGFPQDLEPVVRQLERGLGVVMMRDEKAIETYKWLAEKGAEKIKMFINWATASERVQYIGKYRRSPGLIQVEWKEAFKQTAPAVTRNADGSFNV